MAKEITTKPEHMLPIMIVLGIMFIGICIAMNLFSRARFKKRTNVFVTAGRTTPNQTRRSQQRGPGGGQRLNSYCPSPVPQTVMANANSAPPKTTPGTNVTPVPCYVNLTSGRASVVSRGQSMG